MVASFAPPVAYASAQRDNTKSSPVFPMSSPPIEPHTMFKPSNSNSTLPSRPPFLKTETFTSALSDNDTGESSSNEDEFHLERYSKAPPAVKRTFSRRRRQAGNERLEKDRPGLNIVTDFTISPRRARMHGLVVDKVQSQKPRMRQKYAASVVSAKAEHLRHSGLFTPTALPHNQHNTEKEGLDLVSASAREKASRRPRDQKSTRGLPELQIPDHKTRNDIQGHDSMQTNDQHLPSSHALNTPDNSLSARHAYSPGSQSIMIGISVQEHEAGAHALHNQPVSTLTTPTPLTPQIVVSPANMVEKGSNHNALAKTQGVEAPTDMRPKTEKSTIRSGHLPSPGVPDEVIKSTKASSKRNGAQLTPASASETETIYIDDMSDDENSFKERRSSRRFSSESREQILGSSPQETARHKSQGWWNLMLSPMLSRKGTIKSLATQTSATPPLPSLPYQVDIPRGRFAPPETSDSPETPRRQGLASARASIWSRWTTWEKARDGVSPEDEKNPISFVDKVQALPPQAANNMTHGLNRDDWGNGTAAEYYHACAVDQVKGIQYFECENHSCKEQLPRFRSAFVGVRTDAEVPVDEAMRSNPGYHHQEESIDSRDPAPRMASEAEAQIEPGSLSPHSPQTNAVTMANTKSETVTNGPAPTVPAVTSAEQASGAPPTSLAAVEPSVERKLSNNARSKILTSLPTSQTPVAVPSPGPISPAMQQSMASHGAVPLTDVIPDKETHRGLGSTSQGQTVPWAQTQPAVVTIHNYTQPNDGASQNESITPSVPNTSEQPAKPKLTITTTTNPRSISPESPEAGASPKKSPEKSKEKRNWLPKMNCFKRKEKQEQDPAKRKKRRWAWFISILLFLIVVACILLATLLTRAGDGTPVQNQWLNLTGYPPMPTGISTIARPDLVKQQNQCVAPTTLWSCSLPKENQAEVVPNSPDQPNFRFQIAFQNGTVPSNMTIPVSTPTKRALSLTRRISNPFTSDLFEPNPAPPSRADQLFMGNTTDNITKPFDGEKTPFFITFMPAFPVDPSDLTTNTSTASSRLRRRQDNSSTIELPAPDILDDGSAAPANLLPTSPYPAAQPIRLYNRGLEDEHYGFYMYYDKSIFMRSRAPIDVDAFANNSGIDPEDESGGSSRDQASLRCTFSQSRFMVKIWTNPLHGATLLVPLSGSNETTETTNSATNFIRPGSFPYPATISIDRHGGNVNKKGAYCYGVDELQVIQKDVKSLIPELRGFGGPGLVNPAPSLINGTGEGFDQTAGGIDGGLGGCECTWQNWN